MTLAEDRQSAPVSTRIIGVLLILLGFNVAGRLGGNTSKPVAVISICLVVAGLVWFFIDRIRVRRGLKNSPFSESRSLLGCTGQIAVMTLGVLWILHLRNISPEIKYPVALAVFAVPALTLQIYRRRVLDYETLLDATFDESGISYTTETSKDKIAWSELTAIGYAAPDPGKKVLGQVIVIAGKKRLVVKSDFPKFDSIVAGLRRGCEENGLDWALKQLPAEGEIVGDAGDETLVITDKIDPWPESAFILPNAVLLCCCVVLSVMLQWVLAFYIGLGATGLLYMYLLFRRNMKKPPSLSGISRLRRLGWK
jgi:hypothetical protein